MDADQTVQLGFLLFASMNKSSLQCIRMNEADVKSRRQCQDQNSGRIRVLTDPLLESLLSCQPKVRVAKHFVYKC